MTGVPRVYEKFQARILEKGQSVPAAKSALFHWGVKVGAARGRALLAGSVRRRCCALEAALADRLVFSKIRDGVGGRLRCLVSGSAPLPVDVAEFFHGIGLPITEGYGLTETSPIVTANPPRAPRAGTVGKAIPGVEVRIAEDGEILVRGPNVMMGYYNKPEATADVIKDGWFHTGDIGSLDADGYSRSPTARRTCWSRPAARRSRRSRSRACSSEPARRRGGRARRSPQVRGGADRPRLRRARAPAAGPRPRRAGPERDADAGQLVGRTSSRSTRRSSTALNRELSQFERIKKIAHPAARVHHRDRRADADDEGEAQGRRGEVARGDRADLR